MQLSLTSLQWRRLSAVNLSFNDLTNWDLNGQNLGGANLTNANLSGVAFADTDLRSSTLANANLSGANVTGANRTNTVMFGWWLETSGIDLAIVRRVPHWRRVTVSYALFGGMSAGFGAFIVAALEEHGGLTRSASAVVFSLMGVAGMVAAPVTGALSDRFGRLIMMVLSLTALVVANLSVALGGYWPLIVGAILYGGGASAFPTLIATYVRDSLDSRSFSQALAVMTILFSVMASVLPTLVGAIADATDSFRWPYLLVAGLPAVALVMNIGILRRQRVAGAVVPAAAD